MEIEKIKNLNDDELVAQQKQAAEQIFRLRFQISTGHQDGVKKLRELKKDVARIKTIVRSRQLHGGAPAATQAKSAVAKKKVPASTAKKSAAKGDK